MADKVEVYLERYSDGARYQEFTAPPGTPKYIGDPNEKYIEATTKERFRVVVKLLRGFDFMGSPKVRVEYFVDQGGFIWETLSKSKRQSASPSDRSHREASLCVIEQFIDGQYMDCGLTFGELKTDDDMVLDDHSIAEEADRQGRIVVKLRRGHFAQRKVEDDGGEKSFDPPEHVDTETTHTKVVHKHHVSHVLKHVPLRPSNLEVGAPRGYQRQWVRATGKGSKPIVFTLRYRSRKALLALGIIDENAPVASRSKTGDATVSHRPGAKAKARKDVRDQSNVPTVATETIISSARSPSKGLTPGPLLSFMMHDDDDDDDDDGDEEEGPPAKTHPTSLDTTEQNFNISARPTMSPTPNPGLSVLGPTPLARFAPALTALPVVHSLLSDDEGEDQEENDDEEEHTSFPLFSADDVRRNFALGDQDSQSNDINNDRSDRRDYHNHNDGFGNGDNGEEVIGSEGEMVGPGYATPPRYGGSISRPISVGLNDEERKRAWSEVLQTEQELAEEEAAAILASEKRERRRRELMDVKRSFLDLE